MCLQVLGSTTDTIAGKDQLYLMVSCPDYKHPKE
jgi:hypothetical protein